MAGFKYQLKNMLRDKMCIMTFLLPIVAALAINMLSGVSFESVSENAFGVLEDDLPSDTIRWLNSLGSVSEYKDMKDLAAAVNDPSTQMIGVVESGDGIRTIVSGDELQINTVIGNTLPRLFKERTMAASFKQHLIRKNKEADGLKSLLSVITMITAMFMGCTFNAMNIIQEKEDGITFINEVLPMTGMQYTVQKMALGFFGGILSTAATALICIKIEAAQILPLVLLIVLSAFIASLCGLFIGRLAGGLMAGIAYIKAIMLLFLALPIFFYLAVPPGSAARWLSLALPSSAAFYGLMELQGGQMKNMGMYLAVLAAHCIVWMAVGLTRRARYL